jgi:phosphatidylserine/phosphatidylglycerophosphate/cardiolipin synthase-like enzyme
VVRFKIPSLIGFFCKKEEARPVMETNRALVVGSDFTFAYKVHLSMLSRSIHNASSPLASHSSQRVYSSTFLHTEDEFSERHLAYLAKAAQSGLTVKYIVDGFGFGLSMAKLHALKSAGVDVRIFHPFPKSNLDFVAQLAPGLKGVRQLLFRQHDKILLCGNEIKIGDRNISGGHYGIGNSPIISRELFVESEKLAVQVACYFEGMLASAQVKPWQPSKKVVVSDQRIEKIQQQWNRLFTETEESLTQQEDFRSHLIEAQPFEFLFKPAGKKWEGTPIYAWLNRWMEEAQTELILENAYITLTRALRNRLHDKQQLPNLDMRICTNSLQTLDSIRLAGGWAFEREKLFRLSLPVYERKQPGLMHCKTFLSERAVAVGSANLNHRSLLGINHDTLLVTRDPQIIQDIRQEIFKDFDQKYERLTDPKEIYRHLESDKRGKITSARRVRTLSSFARTFLTY